METNDESCAMNEALQKIDKSLSEICFAYNTEALIKKNGLYLIDLTNRPNVETVQGSLVLRWGYLEENSEDTITKIHSLTDDKKGLLDLALAYYRLGYYDNPLRIECYFSCLTVLIRNISHSDYVSTNTLKEQTKLILKKRNSKFDESRFDKEWNECYADERCSISHGRGSKLVDVSKSNEYQKMVSTVGHWTREVVYFFIDNNQGTD